MSHWPEYMSTASDEIIKPYLTNWNQYIPEIVEAAVAEMEKRGRPVPTEKIEEMRAHFEARRQREIQDDQNNTTRSFFGANNWNQNITADQSTPVYYSELAIQGFSTLLFPLFGAFMLASNIEKIEGKRGFWEVLIFGVLHSGLVFYINTSLLEKPLTPVTLLLNLAGAYILRRYFWEKYIGKNVPYRKRTLVYPFIAAFILIAFIAVALILNF